jgi:aspartate kinase
VEFAREKGITIHARSTHAAGTGTRIEGTASTGIKGVTCDAAVWVLSVKGPPEPLLELLDARQVRGRSLVFEALDGSDGQAMVIVPLQDVHGPEALQKEIAAKLGETVTLRDDLGTVTCVGTGLNTDWSTVRRVISTSALAGAAVFGAFCSPLQVTLVIGSRHLKDVTARLHEALLGA